ncbi:AzlD domain-containing protein [Malaciobacter mytili]|uniref:Branched-chain amino acid ABC transporter n=1 Tax=Malaciobacter mytili LMG 24559 TaxID=1032238 RepID=A0AAX2AHG1_9BACT|nr:AzlD domain-containing protein [Malaciobacter mytili]AXH13879.1 branched-chain amino acid transport protein, AzlD family [Malaciobacter mytili LMG 24559]RXK15468.1 branched-chain amino acid ABC transporter [Malaciobacter mytili LMG 24559]
MQESNLNLLLIIFLVAIGTYTLRISGLLLSNKLKEIKNIDIFLESIPPTLLIALIVPSIIKEGLIGVIASLFIIIIMYKTKNTFLAMFIGVLIVALQRNGLLF